MADIYRRKEGSMNAQQLQFELMKIASFNDFDGERVVKDLEANSDYWSGAIMGRFDGYCELLPLRDIHDGWNVDTLMITTPKRNKKYLEMLANTWGADEVDWLSHEQAQKMLRGDLDQEVLRVWWD